MNRTKSVILADDHAFTLSGMVHALASYCDISVVGTAANGIEAIALIKRFKPDCAILDYSMPGATGLEVLFEGKRWSPDTRFVLITGTPNARSMQELIAAGVNGLFTKSADPHNICAAIARVLDGEDEISPDMQRLADKADGGHALTAREREVLLAVARGLSNPQISQSLGVSPKTVDSHRTSLMRKLDVNSTAALLVRAMKDGLIDVSGDV